MDPDTLLIPQRMFTWIAMINDAESIYSGKHSMGHSRQEMKRLGLQESYCYGSVPRSKWLVISLCGTAGQGHAL